MRPSSFLICRLAAGSTGHWAVERAGRAGRPRACRLFSIAELGLLPKNPHTDGVAPTEATATPIPDATPTLTPVPDATPAAPAATPILA